MDNSFLEVINKGVPISAPISILANDLYELTSNKSKLESKLEKEFSKYVEYLNSIVKSNDIEIFMTLCILSDPETLEKRLHFAPGGLASSILYNLNVDNICVKEKKSNPQATIDEFKDEYTDKIKDRIRRLRLVTSEKNLRKHFPFLYKKYTEQKENYGSLKEAIAYIDDKNTSIINKVKAKGLIRKFYLDSGIDVDVDELLNKARGFSIESFCKSYAESFDGYIDHFDDIVDYLFANSLDIDDLGIEPEKLELYIANISMTVCEHGNENDRQRFMYYVTNYFNSNKERKTKTTPQIRVGIEKNQSLERHKNGYLITPKDLYHRYRDFLAKHPEIQVLDLSKINFEGMNLLEVEKFLFEYLKELQANWEILPEEELDKDIVKVIRNSGRELTEEEREKHRERLMDLLVEKKELYGSTDPFFRVRGKDTFDGYIGFIYPNGKVILDKFYENASQGKLADGEAIYVMNVEDFYRLSQYSKTTLIKDPRVQRIIHAGAWQDRVLEVINSGTKKTTTIDEVKQLIKTNKLEEE